jgi:hypothetical protein
VSRVEPSEVERLTPEGWKSIHGTIVAFGSGDFYDLLPPPGPEREADEDDDGGGAGIRVRDKLVVVLTP